jgi:hypothetical protein
LGFYNGIWDLGFGIWLAGSDAGRVGNFSSERGQLSNPVCGNQIPNPNSQIRFLGFAGIFVALAGQKVIRWYVGFL